MNRTTRILSLLVTLLLALAASAESPYSGNWRLDQDASADLPQRFHQIADWTLTVTEDSTAMTIDVKIRDNGSSEPDVNSHFVYQLDGSDSPIEMTVRTPNGLRKVPAVGQAKRFPTGDLELTTTSEMKMRDNIVKMQFTEHWTRDGDALRIRRTDDSPRGKTTYELVFRGVTN